MHPLCKLLFAIKKLNLYNIVDPSARRHSGTHALPYGVGSAGDAAPAGHPGNPAQFLRYNCLVTWPGAKQRPRHKRTPAPPWPREPATEDRRRSYTYRTHGAAGGSLSTGGRYHIIIKSLLYHSLVMNF